MVILSNHRHPGGPLCGVRQGEEQGEVGSARPAEDATEGGSNDRGQCQNFREHR